MRVAVVDSRGELCPTSEQTALRRKCTVDVLSGYPRPKGIEIAVRTLNAEVAVCDELGDVDEGKAVLAVQNCGVPLLATAHGRALEELLTRPGIRMLHDAGVFAFYVGVARTETGFSYTVTRREEISC